jgi:hypothetical protein
MLVLVVLTAATKLLLLLLITAVNKLLLLLFIFLNKIMPHSS